MCANAQVYSEYAANIRKEYSHVPELDYCKGRAAVLRHLVSSNVFLTDEKYVGGEQSEAQAKSNVATEIEQLEKRAQQLTSQKDKR